MRLCVSFIRSNLPITLQIIGRFEWVFSVWKIIVRAISSTIFIGCLQNSTSPSLFSFIGFWGLNNQFPIPRQFFFIIFQGEFRFRISMYTCLIKYIIYIMDKFMYTYLHEHYVCICINVMYKYVWMQKNVIKHFSCICITEAGKL